MEFFEAFYDDGKLRGLVERGEVHRKGLWHKAAQVLICNSRKELLLQKRAANKDLYASLWDFAVGEHLKPQEAFAAGAARGLQEELGVHDCCLRPLDEPTSLEMRGKGYIDREIQQGFFGVYDGDFEIDTSEVDQVRFVSLEDLRSEFAEKPASFTPWFIKQWPARMSWLLSEGLIE